MNNTLSRLSFCILFGIGLFLILLGVLASDGLFNIDEFIYFSAAQSLRDTGSFAFSNGFEQFGSDDLRLWLLVEGPVGLVSQYPVGTTLAGASLLGVFGQKSLIALNVLAGIGTLIFTFALARRLFPGKFVGEIAVVLLTFCTFWAEYVVGHWPHSISMMTVTAAIYFFVAALDQEKGANLHALAAGAFIGFGMLFRLEGVLLLPGMVALTVLYAKSPVKVLVSGVIGLAPFAVLMTWSNLIRFGSLTPLSYGSAGGGTDLASYFPLGICVSLALLGLVGFRIKGNIRSSSILWVGAFAFALASTVLSSQLLALVIKLIEGVQSLLIDATRLSDPRSGVQSNPDGTLSFWGLPKKALGQSLPWLGCLALLVGFRWKQQQRSILILLTICVIWALPFLLRSWHGGLGLNMRYFLPLLPLLAALSAFLIAHWVERVGHFWLITGVVLGLFFSVLWHTGSFGSVAAFHQITTTKVLILIGLLSLVGGFFSHRSFSGLVLSAVGFGMGVAMLLALQDWMLSQHRRAAMASMSENTMSLEGNFVIYGPPEAHSHALQNPDHLLALPDRVSDDLDVEFIMSACAQGYRVLIPSNLLSSNKSQKLLSIETENQQINGINEFAQVNCTSIPAHLAIE